MLSGTRLYGIINICHIATNELFYHQIQKILQKYANINIVSYSRNERVK